MCLRRCDDDGGVLCLGDACVGDPDVREDYDLEAPLPEANGRRRLFPPQCWPRALRFRPGTAEHSGQRFAG